MNAKSANVIVSTLLITLAMNIPLGVSKESDPFAELDDEIKSNAQTEQNQAKELNEYQAFRKSQSSEYKDWRQKSFDEYSDFRVNYIKQLDNTRDAQLSSWGEAEASSAAKQVIYSDDNKTKTVIDYENNEVRVSVLADEETKPETAKVEASKALSNVIKQEDESSFLNFIENETKVDELLKKVKVEDSPPVIEDQNKLLAKEIEKIESQTRAQSNQVDLMIDSLSSPDVKAEELAAENQLIQAQKLKIQQEKAKRIASLKKQLSQLKKNKQKRAELAKKKVVTYTIPLKNKKALSKAKPYVESVKNESNRWEGVSLSLMLAIIHTESYFNPKAESHIPAYGLMQIVPRTAGTDVNRMLYKKDAPMTQKYLFDAESNIETGVAYANILNSRYLKKITNPLSRKYCIVAAYNTGSGNVARTFNKDKSRNITKAAKVINAMTPDEVYNHLANNLPYDETKHYLERVIKREKIYQSL